MQKSKSYGEKKVNFKKNMYWKENFVYDDGIRTAKRGFSVDLMVLPLVPKVKRQVKILDRILSPLKDPNVESISTDEFGGNLRIKYKE